MSKKRQTLTENALWSARMALRMSVCKQFVYTIICECLKSTGAIQAFLPCNFSVFPTHFQLKHRNIWANTINQQTWSYYCILLVGVRTLLCGLIEIPTTLCWSLYHLLTRGFHHFPTRFQLSRCSNLQNIVWWLVISAELLQKSHAV